MTKIKVRVYRKKRNKTPKKNEMMTKEKKRIYDLDKKLVNL